MLPASDVDELEHLCSELFTIGAPWQLNMPSSCQLRSAGLARLVGEVLDGLVAWPCDYGGPKTHELIGNSSRPERLLLVSIHHFLQMSERKPLCAWRMPGSELNLVSRRDPLGDLEA